MHAHQQAPEKMSHKTTMALFWSTSEIWGSQLINAVVFVVLTRLLDAQAFGLAALLAVFLFFVEFLVAQGLPEALVQRPTINQVQISTVFWFGLGVATLLCALLIALAYPIALCLRQPAFAPVLRWSSPMVILNALSRIQIAQFRRNLNFRPLALRRTCGNLIGGVCGIVLATLGAGVYSLVAMSAVAVITGVLLLWRQSAWRPSFVFSRASMKELLPYSSHSLASSLLVLVNRRSDDLIVGAVLGPVALGFYAVAYRILLMLNNTVTLVMQRVAFPALARLQNRPKRMLGAFQRIAHTASLLGFGVFSALAMLAPTIVPVVFGPHWRTSIPLMQVLAVVGLFQNVLLFNSVLFQAIGHPKCNTIFFAVNALANVLGFILLVRYGTLAIATVLLVNTIVLSPISFAMLRRKTQINLASYLRQFVPPLTAAGLASMASFALTHVWPGSQETLEFLIVNGSLFAVTYALVALALDRKFIRELIDLGKSTVVASSFNVFARARQQRCILPAAAAETVE
jgi:O-antigen/teichoic acid export membrane protein